MNPIIKGLSVRYGSEAALLENPTSELDRAPARGPFPQTLSIDVKALFCPSCKRGGP